MAYINKPKKKHIKTGKNASAAQLRTSKRWIKLRDAYRMLHPLCERCLKDDRITPCEEIHHVIPICKGQTDLEMEALCLDPSNLMALCTQCHHEIHKEMKKGDS